MAEEIVGEVCEWTVTGMDCGACAGKIRTVVERLPGVSGVQLSPMTGKLVLGLEPGTTSREKVETTVEQLGYGIRAQNPSAIAATPTADSSNRSRDDRGDNARHNDSADQTKTWYHTAKGRLVIGTALLLAAAWTIKILASEEIANWAFIAAGVIGVAP